MDIGTFLAGLLAQQDIRIILLLIGLDVVFGIAASIKEEKFEWQSIGRFLTTNVLPYVLVYGALKAVLVSLPDWQSVAAAVFTAITVALLGSIANDLKRLGLNIPIPGLK